MAAGAEQVGLWQELQEQQVSEDLRKVVPLSSLLHQLFSPRTANCFHEKLTTIRQICMAKRLAFSEADIW